MRVSCEASYLRQFDPAPTLSASAAAYCPLVFTSRSLSPTTDTLIQSRQLYELALQLPALRTRRRHGTANRKQCSDSSTYSRGSFIAICNFLLTNKGQDTKISTLLAAFMSCLHSWQAN